MVFAASSWPGSLWRNWDLGTWWTLPLVKQKEMLNPDVTGAAWRIVLPWTQLDSGDFLTTEILLGPMWWKKTLSTMASNGKRKRNLLLHFGLRARIHNPDSSLTTCVYIETYNILKCCFGMWINIFYLNWTMCVAWFHPFKHICLYWMLSWHPGTYALTFGENIYSCYDRLFAHMGSPCACIGSLWGIHFLPQSQRHAH